MSDNLFVAWLGAFLFGQAIEVPIYLRALPGRRRLSALLFAFGATALTHPVVWFVFPRLVPEPYWLMAVCAEAFAVLGEAVYLRLLGARRPLLYAALANSASCGLGLLSRWAFGWP